MADRGKSERAAGRHVSCGVLVTDGERLLLGHATRSARWDIPKGIADPGEDHRTAALRELHEETGLVAPIAALDCLGTYRYLPRKDLALFAWRPLPMPDPAALVCRSCFPLPGGGSLPEFDRFGLFAWQDALARVGRNLARVLNEIRTPLARRAGSPG